MNKYYITFVDDGVTDIKVFDDKEITEVENFVKDIKMKEAIHGSSYGIEKVIFGQEMKVDFQLESKLTLGYEESK